MKSSRLPFHRINRNNGFAMVEVLVAMIVMAVGIIGLLRLQAEGLKNSHSAYLKSQVVSLIDDMADRMRANEAGFKNNHYDTIDTSTLSSNPGFDCMTDNSATSSGTSCDAQELANYDIYVWGKTLSTMLPSGTGTVVCNDSPCLIDSTHTITVLWDDHRTGNADSQFSVIFAR
jgi:type IV pilus assembly protein PilV